MRVSPRESAVNEPSQKPSPTQASRRKLVRGVFSVPAVLTLTTGRPAAATSLTCVQRQQTHDPIPWNDNKPGLVRVPYFKKEHETKYYIRCADVHAKKIGTGVVSGSLELGPSGMWQRVVRDGTTMPAKLGTEVVSSVSVEAGEKGYLMIRYDSNGNITGIGKGGTGTGIGTSCLMSFVG